MRIFYFRNEFQKRGHDPYLWVHRQRLLFLRQNSTFYIFLFFQPGNEWAKGVQRDQGHSSDSSMAKFDGQSGLTVPESILPSGNFPPHKFTIATWMKHRDNKALDKHTKEHIMCKADDHRKPFLWSFFHLFFFFRYFCLPTTLTFNIYVRNIRG